MKDSLVQHPVKSTTSRIRKALNIFICPLTLCFSRRDPLQQEADLLFDVNLCRENDNFLLFPPQRELIEVEPLKPKTPIEIKNNVNLKQ